MKHILVTNDFPPKTGGIQNYLWELWRRLPSESFAVFTRPYSADIKNETAFDAEAPYLIKRSQKSFLTPRPFIAKEITDLANNFDADFLVFDPCVPIGDLGPKLGLPYAHILHGAEVSVPGKMPLVRQRLAKTLLHSDFIITASMWALREAKKICDPKVLPTWHYIPPGVDIKRFVPPKSKVKARSKFGASPNSFLVVCISRLVPRKGMDKLIQAVGQLEKSGQDIELLIAGSGRDEKRLEKIIKSEKASVQLLGRISDEDLPDLYGAADLFVMPCRTRWGGLEQEGFGIVYIEAAACEVPSLAGQSGGAEEAVLDDHTGLIIKEPNNTEAVAEAISGLISDKEKLTQMGKAARQRAEQKFSYDILAEELKGILKC